MDQNSSEQQKQIPVHAIQLDIIKILEKNPDTQFVKVYIESESPVAIKGIELLDSNDLIPNA
jgi:hypothetical protein